jgi:hypothetical protein
MTVPSTILQPQMLYNVSVVVVIVVHAQGLFSNHLSGRRGEAWLV